MSIRIVATRHGTPRPPSPEGLFKGLVRPLPHLLHLPELLVGNVRPGAVEFDDAFPPFPEPPDRVAEALPLPLFLREHLVDVVRDRDVLRHLVLCTHMHTYRFCGLDLLLCLEENRKDREDRRVHMGAVARRARMPPRFVEETVEGLPGLLPQRGPAVHPVVQDCI